MRANDNLTESLRRTIGLMQGELEKSVLTVQTLGPLTLISHNNAHPHSFTEASTASLRATSTTHDTLTTVMDTSKQLITALERADWLDRVVIIAALIFFFLVVLFILKQRIVDRSLRVAFWWTRFIPDFSGDQDLLRAEEGVRKGTSLVSQAVTAAVTSASMVVSSAIASSSTASAVPSSSSEESSEVSSVLQSVLSSETTSLSTDDPSLASDQPAETDRRDHRDEL